MAKFKEGDMVVLVEVPGAIYVGEAPGFVSTILALLPPDRRCAGCGCAIYQLDHPSFQDVTASECVLRLVPPHERGNWADCWFKPCALYPSKTLRFNPEFAEARSSRAWENPFR